MELIKKNIHMEREKCRTVTQTTIEEDVNIKDQDPDALKVITEKGRVVVEEVYPLADYVVLKGKLDYSILYLGEEEEIRPYFMEGHISFEEKVHMEGVTQNDSVLVKSQIEDMSVSLINSRKLSIRSLITWNLYVDEIYDEAAVVDIVSEDAMEICKKPLNVSALAASTKDIFRVREEIELPAGMPNIFQIIWKDLQINDIEFRLLDDKIAFQGEILCFFLYEGEGENSPIQYYEVTRAFSGSMEVDGCRENMISDISFEIEHEDVEIRPDFDGEERIFGIDIAVNVSIKLMETQSYMVVTDVYGITKDIEPVLKPGSCNNIMLKNTGKMKLSQTMKTADSDADILQICHSSACLYREDENIVENGLELSGVLSVKNIYVTKDNELPYNCITGHIPYTYTLEAPGIQEGCSYRVDAGLEQVSATASGGDEIDVKAQVVFRVMVWNKEEEALLYDIAVGETDIEKRDKLPGMVVYVAGENDTIWNVGKKYYVPMNTIREINQLSKDELNYGDKILIVKEMI